MVKQILAAATLIAALTFPAVAQTPPVPPASTAPATTPATVAIPLPPPVVSYTMPDTVSRAPATVVNAGTLVGEVLTWLIAAFGSSIAGLLVLLIKRAFTLVGVKINQQMSDQLDDTLVRGLNLGAQEARTNLQGKGEVDVKNAIIATAIQYAQSHKADTIKALGLDPQSGAAVEALRARIATVITDESQPTPPVLDPPAAPKAA